MIGKKHFFGVLLALVFGFSRLFGSAGLPPFQDTLSHLNKLDLACKVHLKNLQLDSMRLVAAELKGLASAWIASHPSDRQGSYYLMVGYLHQSNGYNLESKNTQAIQGYERALALSIQIGDSIKRHSIYNNMGVLYHNLGQFNRAFHFHSLALAERLRIQDSIFLGDTYNSLGIIYMEWKRYDEAALYFQWSLRYRRGIGAPVEKLAETFNNLGRVWAHREKWILGTMYYGMAWRLFLEERNQFGQVYILNNVAVVLRSFGFYKQAQDLLKLALLALPDKQNVVYGDLHFNLGNIYFENRQMPQALTHLMQSQRIFLKLESAHKLAVLNRSLGKFYVQNHQISLARSAFRKYLRYYESGRIFGIACYVLQEYASTFERSDSDSLFYFLNRSLDLATEKNLKAERASTLVKLGTYFLNIGDLPQAFAHFEVCLKTAQGTDSALYMQEARRGLISCYESEGKWKEAAVLNEEWLFENRLSGGVNNKIKEQLQNLLQAQSHLQESIQSANKIGELRRRQATKNWAYLMVLLGVLLALAITVIFSLLIYIRKREHDALRLKMESDFSGLKGMINQHFMANILNSIKSLINQGKIETADTYLNKFSALLRGVLNQTKSTLIPLDEELRFIHLYIELEQLRFPGQIEFEVVVDPQLDSKNIFVPAMLLHPILENSIQHGRRGGEIPLKLFLTIFPQAGRLVCMVQDDGIGLEAAQTGNAAGKNFSFGLSLTEQRIKLLGKQLKVQVDLHIEDVLDAQSQASGTRVVLQIPLTYSSVS